MKAGRSDAVVRDACFYVGAWVEDVGAWVEDVGAWDEDVGDLAAENGIAAPKDVLPRGDVRLCVGFNAELLSCRCVRRRRVWVLLARGGLAGRKVSHCGGRPSRFRWLKSASCRRNARRSAFRFRLGRR